MTLYEIDSKLTALVDPETGELSDYEAFEALQMEKDAKIENIACWIKDLKSDEQALKSEIDNLTARKRAAENRRTRLSEYLQTYLNGEKYKSARVNVSYRKSTKLEIQDEIEFASNCDIKFLRLRHPEINKEEVKKALQAGEVIPGAALVQNSTIQIK